MMVEGPAHGLIVEPERPIQIRFNGVVVGDYIADLLVNSVVIIELKSVAKLLPEHEAQLLNYLKATPIEVGLLLNFGPKAEFKRKTYDNFRKGTLSWTNWPTEQA
jgi:GxxExxY protein